MQRNHSGKIVKLLLSASSIALTLGTVGLVAQGGFFGSPAAAQDQHEGGQGGQGGQGSGGQGSGGHGGGGGHDEDGAETPPETDGDLDGRGPQAGAGRDGDHGGQPVWAQEGIPEVELGRLSVARSPDHVLDRALEEAVNTLTPEMVEFYNQSLNDMIDDLRTNWDTISLIDSPLQNLALLQDALDGTSALAAAGVTTSTASLIPVFLGVASDKTMPITTDTVVALFTILGYRVTVDSAEQIATAAEAVRLAVLDGHG